MKIPLKWLSDFVALDRSVPELAHLLTMSGLEVEAITPLGQLPPEIVSARLVSVQPHPNAERLTLCQVDDGEAVRQVVCGARNMKTGDVVVLAKPGAVLPGGTRIERARLRGESSEGMLCSERELGLSEAHEGLLILEAGTPAGRPFSEIFPGADTVLEINITPNRADCLSVLGVARDVAALTGAPLKGPVKVALPPASGPTPARLTVASTENCPTYFGRVMTGVQVGPSPSWLVSRLAAVGVRSINNVVDATNYVLMERGQPLHAFDLDRLAGGHLIVRQAREGERIRTLDGVERTLDARDLAICDEQGPVAIAGVMGGAGSAVSAGTTRILIEAAWFLPESVRATARRTGLHTDASHRFERGVDPEGVLPALDAVAALIAELTGGRLAGGVLEAVAPRSARRPISMSPARVNALLGLEVPSERMAAHLEALQMTVVAGGQGFDVTPPSYRLDIETEADLAEEAARMEGYEQIPATLPLTRLQSPGAGVRRRSIRTLVEYLASRGLDQVVNYGFISPAMIDALRLTEGDPRRSPARLLNPLSEELSVMRTLLLPSLLKTAVLNERRESPDLKIFEVGKVFLPPADGVRPDERYHLAILMMGSREPRAWTSSRGDVDVYDLKGVVESVASHLRVQGLTVGGDALEEFLAPGQSWGVQLGGKSIGSLGALHPEVARALGLEQDAYVMELELEPLWQAPRESRRLVPLPRFPAVLRDLAVIVGEEARAEELIACIRGAGGPLLESVSLFDLYRGRSLGDGKKSMAFNLVYRSEDRTLVEGEVQQSYDRVVKELETRMGAQLRA